MKSDMKPWSQWKSLTMTPNERNRLLMSITFHIIALACVVWSLFVLIGEISLISVFECNLDKTAEELRAHEIRWPFWTKLVVVGVGFTGGLVFMYVQVSWFVPA